MPESKILPIPPRDRQEIQSYQTSPESVKISINGTVSFGPSFFEAYKLDGRLRQKIVASKEFKVSRIVNKTPLVGQRGPKLVTEPGDGVNLLVLPEIIVDYTGLDLEIILFLKRIKRRAQMGLNLQDRQIAIPPNQIESVIEND